MDDEKRCGDQNQPIQNPNDNRHSRSPEIIKRFFEKRRADKAKESPPDKAARSTANATWVIAFLTLVMISVTISQYVIFSRQLNVMQGQLGAMEADRRPWIKIEPEVIANIDFTRGFTIIPIKFYLTNIGSPQRSTHSSTKKLL